jgi:hypothetical protein
MKYLPAMASSPEKPADGATNEIKRFPRLVDGGMAAAIEILSRVVPQFEVRLNKMGGTAATELVFVIPVPNELRESYSALFSQICGSRTKDWENAIADGFRNTEYNRKALSEFITPQLRRAFAEGVRIWLEKSRTVSNPGIGPLEEELSNFDKLTKMKPGPQADPRAAVWAVKRLTELRAGIKEIRRRCKDRSSIGTEALKQEINNLCSYETYRTALEQVTSKGTQITPWVILTPEIKVQEIALAVITTELPTSGHIVDLNKTSLKTLIKLGRKLMASLDRVPQPLS